jgi:hypothetical protein
MLNVQSGRWFIAIACVLALVVTLAQSTQHPAVLGDDAASSAAAEPVEPDMHEFMEYAFEPTFQRLKPAMAAEPADAKGWKVIKADGLILAEGGNLLLARVPDENAADWTRLSLAVRTHGGALYAAGKKRDFAAAKTAYTTMIENCNACHTKFAEGEHQLEP